MASLVNIVFPYMHFSMRYIKLILKIRSVAPPEVTQLRERGVLYPFRGADKSGILHGVACEDLLNRRNEFQIFAWEEKYLKLNF